jgi:gamma-glutamyltranspeptidase/glutathione hydrolase
MSLLLMGGDMQAQGHAQVLVDIFDLGANLQTASDMARFRHSQVPNRLALEQGLYDLVGKDLAASGHQLAKPDSEAMGGFQAIAVSRTPDGKRIYRAGSDHRKDGQAVGY